MCPRRRQFVNLLLTLLVAAIIPFSPGGAAVGRADSGPQIHLQRATFDPLAGQPAFRPDLTAAAPAAGRPSYRLVQFAGPILPEWKDAAAGAGAELLEYVPDYAFIARLQPGAEKAVSGLPFVRWVGPFHPAYKLSPALDEALANPQGVDRLQLRVRLFQGEDMQAAERALAALGAGIADRSPSAWGTSLRVNLQAAGLANAAQLPAVAWIEPVYPFKLCNDVARSSMGVNAAWSRIPDLYGSGQVVAIADTGLDTGSLATLSADFSGRVPKTYALGRVGDWSDDDGHGTHVAGSLLGNGALSGSNPGAHSYTSSFAGVAPEASVVFQSIMDAQGELGGLPSDLNYLFQPPYDDGARIHSDSWGGPTGGAGNPYGGYPTSSRDADVFAWAHPDMTILFAAGNEGTDANRNGVVDPDSIAAPGTAKNVVTVGATESFRASGGYNMTAGACWTWGDCWPNNYGAPPISIDPLSSNVNGLAAFSSRGPTDDGRVKPDLIAPGTNIISSSSHDTAAGTGWGVYDSNYIYMGGTSMATPLAAGAAALVRDWYNDQKGVANPSAALMKATLINGATAIAPGQYGTGTIQEVPNATPNNVSGWGRVNVADSVAPNAPARVWFEDHSAGLSTGGQVTYWFTTSTALVASAGTEPLGQLLFEPPVAAAAPPRQGSKPGAPPTFAIPDRIELPAGAQAVPESPTAASAEMVVNGGFETGNLSGWYADGQPPGYLPSATTSQFHSGRYSARLTNGNYQIGRIDQIVAFPAGLTSATLTFWLRIDSNESWRYWDVFWAGLYRTSDGFLALPLGYLDAVDRSAGWVRVRYLFDANGINMVKGQSYYLLFGGLTDSLDTSRFYVDDVSLQYDTAPLASRRPFRVTLTWTDYPGAEYAAKELVNDLDLRVWAPNGTSYYGNNASASAPDQKNNVETVWLADGAPAGTWAVTVRAANVPQGPQPYALVVSGSDLTRYEPVWDCFVFLPLAIR